MPQNYLLGEERMQRELEWVAVDKRLQTNFWKLKKQMKGW